MSLDLTNPFANTSAVPAVVTGIVPKLGTYTPQVTRLPYVPPAGFTQFFQATDRLNILNSLSYVLNGVANGQFLSLNDTQIEAINTVFQSWSVSTPYGATLPGNVTITAAGLQNTVVAMDAVNYLQTTGLLTTQQDLLNSNGQIQLVTGYAPNGAMTMTIHDQHVICEMPGGDWAVSNVGNGAIWDALAVAVMPTYSDQCIAVDQCYGYVVLFGLQSMEWWLDQGQSAVFPYVILPGSAQNIGLPARFSRAQFMGNLCFLGRFKTGQMHVFQTNGTGAPLIISTPDIDQIINNFPNGEYQDAVASTDDFNGHPVYILTFISAQRTFMFDGITRIWSEIQSGTADYQRHMTTLRATLNNGTVASDYESGNVYFVDPNSFTDNGYIIKREWVSKHIRDNGNSFSVPLLELIMQVGTGSQKNGPSGSTGPSGGGSGSSGYGASGYGASGASGATGATGPQTVVPYTACPKIELFVSTDGGNTWSQGEEAELGEVGQYTTRVYWRQLGTARDFLFKFRMTDPVPFVIAAAYASIEPGTPD